MLGYISGYEDGYNRRTGLPYQVVKHFADDKLTLKLNQYKEDYLKTRKLLDESIPKSKVKEAIENSVCSYDCLKEKIEILLYGEEVLNE